MLLRNRVLLTVILLLWPVALLTAQQYSSEGTEFYVSFLLRFSANPTCEVTFSSVTNTSVTIENSAKSYSQTYAVLAGIPYTVIVPRDKCVADNYDKIENGAVHITSTSPITVYCMNYISAIADGALVYPKEACGTEYYTASYDAISANVPSKFVAIAFEDNTVLNITPSVVTKGAHSHGVTYTVTLNKGETYMDMAVGLTDLTGTHIECTTGKKFAIFSGTECVNIPNTTCPYCDVLMEQMLPVTSLGKKYLLAPLSTETVTPKYTYRVIATDKNTTLKINGVPNATMQKGQVITVNNQSGPLSLEADKPIMVVQYTQGSTCVAVGDPAMVVIPSLEQFINRVSYATAGYSQFNNHYSYILLKTSSIGTLKINGTVVAASAFNTFAASPQYSYANIPLPKGNHLVECPDGFIMIAYGYGKDISYAYIGGSSFKNLSHNITISPPLCDSLNFVMANDGDTQDIAHSYWDFGDGTTDTGKVVKKTYTKHGIYTVTNIITSSLKSEPDTVFQVLRTLPNPQAGFSVNDTGLCFRNNFFVIEDTTIFLTGSKKKKLRWEFLNQPAPTFDSVKIFRLFGSEGIYTARLIMESADGCIGSKEQKLYVHPQSTVAPVFGDTALCLPNHAFTVQNMSTVSSGSIVGSIWTYSDGDVSTAFNPPPKKFTSAGTYIVKVLHITDKGCRDSATQQLIVYPTISPNFTVKDVCLGDTSYFENTTTNAGSGVVRWFWDFHTGDSANTKHAGYQFTDTGHYTVSLASFTSQGCGDTLTLQEIAGVVPKPRASFSIEPKDSSGFYYTVLFNNTSTISDSYLWDLGNGVQTTDESPLNSYYRTGLYKISLIATNSFGCIDSYDTTLSIVLPTEIYIPNAFTPGRRDNVNPVFKVEGVIALRSFEMLIFDRWGELLFASDDINKGWDGTYKNTDVPDGVYLYAVNIIADGRVANYRGTLHLLR